MNRTYSLVRFSLNYYSLTIVTIIVVSKNVFMNLCLYNYNVETFIVRGHNSL